MSNRWHLFDKDRIARNHKSGFLIIKPKKNNVIPFVCPLCDLLMRNQNDILSYHKNKVCFSCETHLLIPNKKKWDTGWRPTKQQIKEYIKNVRNNY